MEWGLHEASKHWKLTWMASIGKERILLDNSPCFGLHSQRRRGHQGSLKDMKIKLFQTYSLIALSLLLTACAATPNPSPENNPDEIGSPYDASEGAPTPDEPTTIDAPSEPNVDTSAPPDASEAPPEEPDTRDAGDPPEGPSEGPSPDAQPSVQPRLLALGKDGQIASLQLTSPWKVLASGDLKQPVASARCSGGRCVVVHPSPADSLSVVNPLDLSATKMQLSSGADPRDVAFVDQKTIVVSQYGKSALLLVDLDSGSKETIDLSALADDDGLPETLRMARCGRRVFIQLLRIDHKTGAPSTMGPALAVVDVDLQGKAHIVDADPNTPGQQAIKLSGSPNFDMPVDCKREQLHLAEPKPLMQGGGWYELVNTTTLKTSKSPIAHSAQVGGFAVVKPGLYWLITHTATSPAGNSSHLNLVGAPDTSTYNTFARDKVDELVLDPTQDLLFFPDNCETASYPQCASGVHVFHALTGKAQPQGHIKLGFPPMEVAISR